MILKFQMSFGKRQFSNLLEQFQAISLKIAKNATTRDGKKTKLIATKKLSATHASARNASEEENTLKNQWT